MTSAAARLDRWRRALLLPGETDLLASATKELSDYFGITPKAAEERAREGVRRTRDAWNASPRGTRKEIEEFYNTSEDYIFELVHWHATLSEAETLANVAALEIAERTGVRRYLDFGGGVGANLLLFAASGIEVGDADISDTLLAFARWRLERRGVRATFFDLKSETLPAGAFDLLTAVDVLEHVPDPVATLGAALPALSPRGLAIVALGFGFDPDRPMHLVHSPRKFLSGVRALGLEQESARELGDFSFLRAYRRVERSRAVNRLVLAQDTLCEGARGMMRFAATLGRRISGRTA
jgi:mycofactocin glycosyltransferase